jgi:probable nitrogen fixation protein
VSGLGKFFNRNKPPVALACDLAVQPGDSLVLNLAESDLLRAGVMAYLLPALLSVAGAIAATLAGLGDAAAAAAMVAGLPPASSSPACSPARRASTFPAPLIPPLQETPMTDTATLELDPILETDFIKEMVKQMRALDSYGTYDGWPVTRILAPYVLTKEQRREIPVIGDPDEQTLSRVKAFYNGIAALIEKECGLMAVPMMNITHEGFGRALITVGLVVIDRTVRDVHRYGYQSSWKMKEESRRCCAAALQMIGSPLKSPARRCRDERRRTQGPRLRGQETQTHRQRVGVATARPGGRPPARRFRGHPPDRAIDLRRLQGLGRCQRPPLRSAERQLTWIPLPDSPAAARTGRRPSSSSSTSRPASAAAAATRSARAAYSTWSARRRRQLRRRRGQQHGDVDPTRSTSSAAAVLARLPQAVAHPPALS